MILLPDEDEEPVSDQVNGVIGEALRQGVAGAEFSPGFQAKLSAALDALERDEQPANGPAAPALPGAPEQGAEAAEAAS